MLSQLKRIAGCMFVGGGVMYFLRGRTGMGFGFFTTGAIAFTTLQLLSDFIDSCSRRIPQYVLFKQLPGEEFTVLCDEEVLHLSTYTFRYSGSDKKCTITGIACVPLSAVIQSPVARVVGGGLKESHVAISLTPEEEGPYDCRIIITGKKQQPPRKKRRNAAHHTGAIVPASNRNGVVV